MDTILDPSPPHQAQASSHLPPPHAAEPRTALRAPGLTQFRANPFRVLRLPASVSPARAVWQAEKTLARLRAGVAQPEHDLVPWLPAPDEVEVQEAAQKLEEPLRRLREQLLWFDLAGDPHGQYLAQALAAGDGDGLRAYLGLAQSIAMDQQPVAHRINQANLRLLLAGSWLAEVGPTLPGAGATAAPVVPLTLVARDSGGERVQTVEDVHALFAGLTLSARARAWPGILADGLRRWAALLAEPMTAAYVDQQIAALGDELVTDADVEPLLAAVRAALGDLMVGELKLRLMHGQAQGAGDLFQVIAESGFDLAVWQLALRPLKALLTAELEELEPLVDERRPADLDDLRHYFKRVAALRAGWRQLDPQNLLGPDDLADEAIARGFARLRAVENPATRVEALRLVVGEAAAMATSASLTERIIAFGKRVAEYRDDLCHWCGKREATRNT
jgi:hypothetical protein